MVHAPLGATMHAPLTVAGASALGLEQISDEHCVAEAMLALEAMFGDSVEQVLPPPSPAPPRPAPRPRRGHLLVCVPTGAFSDPTGALPAPRSGANATCPPSPILSHPHAFPRLSSHPIFPTPRSNCVHAAQSHNRHAVERRQIRVRLIFVRSGRAVPGMWAWQEGWG